MSNPSLQLSPNMREIEELLDSPGSNDLTRLLRHEQENEASRQGLEPGQYDFYAQRSHSSIGNEVFRLKSYDDETLHGLANSGVLRFRNAAESLSNRAKEILNLANQKNVVEFDYQCSLFWPEMGVLTQYLGTNDEISEIVAELRTIRLQFAKIDTTPEILGALAVGLQIASSTVRLKTEHVDQILDELEKSGADSFYPDAFSGEE